MGLIIYSLILLASFYLLARVCDNYFVEALDKISVKLKMSSDMAGATLMAVGSSAPELFVALIALLKPGGHEAIGMGTIIGSALFNILVIIGVAAAVKKAVLNWQPVVRDTLFYSLSIVILLITFWDGVISWGEAGVFLLVYLVYLLAIVNWKKIFSYKDKAEDIETPEEKEEEKPKEGAKKILIPLDKLLDKLYPASRYYYKVFFISIVIIGFLSWALVESAVGIAEILQIPSAVIALTVLAIGTSVPDLLSSIIVAKQGRGGMAISNAIGSNIFDILIGLALPWFVILSFSPRLIKVSTENLLSSIMLLFATVLVIFFLLLMRRWKIGHRAGYFLIGLYVLYLAWSLLNIFL